MATFLLLKNYTSAPTHSLTYQTLLTFIKLNPPNNPNPFNHRRLPYKKPNTNLKTTANTIVEFKSSWTHRSWQINYQSWTIFIFIFKKNQSTNLVLIDLARNLDSCQENQKPNQTPPTQSWAILVSLLRSKAHCPKRLQRLPSSTRALSFLMKATWLARTIAPSWSLILTSMALTPQILTNQPIQ